MDKKMKKKVLAIIIIMLMTVTLFVGCVTERYDCVQLEDLIEHSTNYLDKNVTVKVVFDYDVYENVYTIKQDNVDLDIAIKCFQQGNVMDCFPPTILMIDEEYYIKGIFRYGEFVSYSPIGMLDSCFFGNKRDSGKYLEIRKNEIELVFEDKTNRPSLSNIAKHPYAYMNRKITITGTIDENLIEVQEEGFIIKTSGLYSNNVIENFTIIPNCEYSFEGYLERYPKDICHLSVPSWIFTKGKHKIVNLIFKVSGVSHT